MTSALSPAAILAKALARLDDAQLTEMSIKLDIPGRMIRRAANGASGQPTHTAYHVRLCAYLGIDPVTGLVSGPDGALMDFAPVMFALAVKMARMRNKHALRRVKKETGLSISVISRIENGDPRAFEAVLTLCRYAGLDPRNYIVPAANVSRAVTGNTLTPNADSKRAA